MGDRKTEHSRCWPHFRIKKYRGQAFFYAFMSKTPLRQRASIMRGIISPRRRRDRREDAEPDPNQKTNQTGWLWGAPAPGRPRSSSPVLRGVKDEVALSPQAMRFFRSRSRVPFIVGFPTITLGSRAILFNRFSVSI